MPDRPQLKHRRVYDHLRHSILQGEYSVGERIPSEAALQKAFSTSRITVTHALRDLARDGYLVRRQGSGSFVKEGFQPVQQPLGMLTHGGWGVSSLARAVQAADSHLVISDLEPGEPAVILRGAEEICRRHLGSGVRGVVFAPFVLPPEHMWVNEKIAELFKANGIPIVLFDRDICSARRSDYDLVGCEDREGAYRLTRHLIRRGRRRIVFLSEDGAASTISKRIAGYCDAMEEAGISLGPSGVRWLRPSPPEHLAQAAAQELAASNADAFVCTHDNLAAKVLCSLLEGGIRVPEDVAVVGFNGEDYAALLPVPLTTVRLPLEHIARGGVKLLLERIADPSLPARELLFGCQLIVRQSCGARLSAEGE